MFSNALRSEKFEKTFNAFIPKLHFENGSQDFLGTTCSNLQGLYKKVLSNKSGAFFFLNSFFYLQKVMKNSQNFQKIFKHLFAQKNASWLTTLILLKR